jgi:signal transduction histidine kinase
MLLRGVAQNAALQERVRRAGELAEELRASRERLTEARDVERRRLISELGNATTERLAALRADLLDAARAIAGPAYGGDGGRRAEPDAEAAQRAVHRARAGLDELLDRFRLIARGVYPSVLRDHGPFDALDELAADLPRPVRLTGRLDYRLPWEIESGIYFVAASAIQLLAARGRQPSVELHLVHSDSRLSARITDPNPEIPLGELRSSLVHDGDRLAALGGDVEVANNEDGAAIVHAWLPDQLAPSVDLVPSVAPRAVSA